MLLISLKDEPKLNPAVNSSPSSWGKTWITMTQRSSTALSMERTSSSVWRTSGRPGKHLKVIKGKKPKNPFPGVPKSLDCRCPGQSVQLWGGMCCFSSLVPGLVLFQLPFEVWIPRISSGLVLPHSFCCTWAWPPKDQFLFCSSALEMCVKCSQNPGSSNTQFQVELYWGDNILNIQ